MKRMIEIKSLKEMEQLAKHIASHVTKGFLVGLEGDLGAGKTTFTQFLGKALGIKDRINSPTFTIMKIYDNDIPLYHIDAYRLNEDFTDYDIEDYIEGNGLCVVEWYTNILSVMPENRLNIHIKWIGDTQRKVTLEGSGYYEHVIETFNH